MIDVGERFRAVSIRRVGEGAVLVIRQVEE